jgi:hypothetical protein
MTSTPAASSKLAVNRTRPSGTAGSGAAHVASSPQTPLNRSVSASLYNSPSASFRADEENLLIFEIGARVLRAGFAGESKPRCEVSYSPNQLRRLGDYRQHAPDYDPQSRKWKKGQEHWGRDGYELWAPDLRGQDLSYIGERIERLVREVEASHLMLDSRPRKIGLVVSPQLPRPLLELALSALFGVLQGPTVTIFASNIMAVVSSGLRSGLVVDIGWSETTVSAVFEFREVSQSRTIRASRLLTREFAKILGDGDEMTVENAEDLLIRLGWCRSRNGQTEQEESGDIAVAIDVHGGTFQVTRSALSSPVEEVLFTSNTNPHEMDDHELPIHILAYNALLQLPVDVRKVCMPRIIVTGGASNIPGVKTRLLQELEYLVSTRGWNPIKSYGSVSSSPRHRADVMTERPVNMQSAYPNTNGKTSEKTTSPPQDLPTYVPAHSTPQERDEILEKIEARNGVKPKPLQGVIRGVQTLGPWAGVSLTTSLRVRGVAEIEREKFMSAGLTGVLSKTNISTTGRVASGSLDRTSTSLATWL